MNSHSDRHPSSHLSETWSELTRPCAIITWDGLVKIGEHLHVDRIFYTTHARPSVLRVPRPCLYMLGSSSQPKCIACVPRPYLHMLGSSSLTEYSACAKLACTRCIRTLSLSHPIITWCLGTTNFGNGAYSGRILLSWNLVRDHLIMLSSIKAK